MTPLFVVYACPTNAPNMIASRYESWFVLDFHEQVKNSQEHWIVHHNHHIEWLVDAVNVLRKYMP